MIIRTNTFFSHSISLALLSLFCSSAHCMKLTETDDQPMKLGSSTSRTRKGSVSPNENTLKQEAFENLSSNALVEMVKEGITEARNTIIERVFKGSFPLSLLEPNFVQQMIPETDSSKLTDKEVLVMLECRVQYPSSFFSSGYSLPTGLVEVQGNRTESTPLSWSNWGLMLEHGLVGFGSLGFPKLLDHAYSWYKNAASERYVGKEGHSLAQRRLGDMYYYGRHVGKSDEKAKEWYTKAASQGDVLAQYRLEEMNSRS